jgi:hypothetical protein
VKRYTLTECYELLHVDPKTFRSWLQKAGIEPAVSKADPRVKYLDFEQVQYLAREHDRVLHSVKPGPEVIPPAAYKTLVDQVEDLDRQRADLLGRLAAVHEEARHSITDLQGGLSLALEELGASLASRVTELVSIVDQQRHQYEALAQQSNVHDEAIRQVRSELAASREDLGLAREQGEAAQVRQAQVTSELRQAVDTLPKHFETVMEQRAHEVYDAIEGLKKEVAADFAAITQRIDQVEARIEGFATQIEAVRITALGSELRADAQDQAQAQLQSALAEIQAGQAQQAKPQAEKTPARRARRKVDQAQ